METEKKQISPKTIFVILMLIWAVIIIGMIMIPSHNKEVPVPETPVVEEPVKEEEIEEVTIINSTVIVPVGSTYNVRSNFGGTLDFKVDTDADMKVPGEYTVTAYTTKIVDGKEERIDLNSYKLVVREKTEEEIAEDAAKQAEKEAAEKEAAEKAAKEQAEKEREARKNRTEPETVKITGSSISYKETKEEKQRYVDKGGTVIENDKQANRYVVYSHYYADGQGWIEGGIIKGDTVVIKDMKYEIISIGEGKFVNGHLTYKGNKILDPQLAYDLVIYTANSPSTVWIAIGERTN